MIAVPRIAQAAALGVLALASLAAGAQQVFRIVGPDGRVTFSDRPPPDGKGVPASTVGVGGASSTASLPFELRNVVNRYPVTLYSGPDCAPCVGGRSYLITRGIPFIERTVTSEEDIAALTRLAGAARLPFLTIGGQQLRGYSEIEWGQFLDAAGYPKSSQLPGGFRNAPAQPLVATQQTKPPATPEPASQANNEPSAATQPPPVSTPGPGGIRF